MGDVEQLPYSIRILLESVLRNCDGQLVFKEDVHALASWDAAAPAKIEDSLQTGPSRASGLHRCAGCC